MTEAQTEQQRREQLSYPYHPDSAEGLALCRYREGTSEQDWVTLIEPGEEVELAEIERRMEARGIQVKNGRVQYPPSE